MKPTCDAAGPREPRRCRRPTTSTGKAMLNVSNTRRLGQSSSPILRRSPCPVPTRGLALSRCTECVEAAGAYPISGCSCCASTAAFETPLRRLDDAAATANMDPRPAHWPSKRHGFFIWPRVWDGSCSKVSRIASRSSFPVATPLLQPLPL